MGRRRKSIHCRKELECIPCVRKGCMFPGMNPYPCRESWGDMEGDFPFNPPPRTVADCLELTSSIPVRPSRFPPSTTATTLFKSEYGSSTNWCLIICIGVLVVAVSGIVINFLRNLFACRCCGNRLPSASHESHRLRRPGQWFTDDTWL